MERRHQQYHQNLFNFPFSFESLSSPEQITSVCLKKQIQWRQHGADSKKEKKKKIVFIRIQLDHLTFLLVTSFCKSHKIDEMLPNS